MQTTESDLLFQTLADQLGSRTRERKRAAALTLGSSIQVGKVIDFVVSGSDAFIAEAGWRARRVDLTTGKTLQIYKGHSGPVTSVVVYKKANLESKLLITASWDKTIKIWEVESGTVVTTLHGHADFVKCLAVVSSFLISSGSDRVIKVWRLDAILSTIECKPVQNIRRHARPVDCIAVASNLQEGDKTIKLWTGDSMGSVNEWSVTDAGLNFVRSLGGHETSVTDLLPADGGIWSASLDKTAILHDLCRSQADRSIPLETLPRAICAIPQGVLPNSLMLIGGDDEDLTVWESADDWVTYRKLSVIRAHSDSITSIRIWRDGSFRVVTGSLDGTLRRWTTQDLLNPPPLKIEPTMSGGMTEEEERELEAMLDSD